MRFFILFCFLFSTASWGQNLKVLTYKSLTGKGSLGEYVLQEYLKICPKCKVEFVLAGEASNLVSKLRRDKARPEIDVVWGLDYAQYHNALEENLILKGEVFEKAPYAIMVDTEKLPPSEWPRSWSELEKKMTKKILIEDPRLSGTGLGWLRFIFEAKALSLEQGKKVTARVFPSWSSAYGAFVKGEAPAVWSFLTSEAYHRCVEKTSRYRALPLKEGYPLHEEWLSLVKNSPKNSRKESERFISFILSDALQKEIPLKNWMLPAKDTLPLPECYKELPRLQVWMPTEERPVSARVLRSWNDEWSL